MAAVGRPGIDAVLVGYDRPENLGLRSILSYVHARGRASVLVPFEPGEHARVLSEVRRLRPRLVGFSLIFQLALDEFRDLMRYLRESGVAAHFTAGGHFPSLCPEETFALLPDLDSIVCGEGEITLDELLDRLEYPQEWDRVHGLAFRRGANVVVTPPRPLIADLDSLPPVYRGATPQITSGIKMASMAASRGCLFNCSFCSIRQFYGGSPGPLRRTRSPRAVVDEMQTLFERHGVRFFSFQDDDFAARTPQQRAWLQEFLEALAKAGLADQALWKISCRVDDLSAEFLEPMLQHGLAAVYLGVESGSEAGLRVLNKRATVAQNLAAVNLVKSYNIALALGFMLFDPSSTMDTIRENLAFLREIGEDGYFPINFCKMLPYAGTPIEAELRRAGRLTGPAVAPDYSFLSREVASYELMVKRIFTQRNFGPEALAMRLQDADFCHRLGCALGLAEPEDDYGRTLRELIRSCNSLALQTLSALHGAILSRGFKDLLEEQDTLVEICGREWEGEMAVAVELAKLNAAASKRGQSAQTLHPAVVSQDSELAEGARPASSS